MDILTSFGQFFGSDFMLRVYSSFISSFVFIFFLLYAFRPRIGISDWIVASDFDFIPDEDKFYMFKIVNKCIFPLYDIELSLYKIIPFPDDNGKTNNRITPLEFRTKRVSHTPRCKLIGHGNGAYALRFRTYEDLDSILREQQNKLRLQIKAKHGLTGLTRVFTKEFVDRSKIANTEFKFGKDLGVK